MIKRGGNTMKRALAFILFIIIATTLLCACSKTKENKSLDLSTATETTETFAQTDAPTEAPTEIETVDDSWKEIYIDYLNNYEYRDNYEFALVNVDNDNIPELYEHAKQRPAFSNLSWIYQGNVYSQSLMIDGFEYIEGENLFMSTGIQSGIQADFVFMINGNEAMELSKGTASRMIQGQERYNWNGEDVSEEEYNTLRTAVFDSSKAKTVDNFLSIDGIIATVNSYQ